MTTPVPLWRRALLILAVLNVLLCPLLFVGINFFPGSLGFVEALVCPPGMQLGSETETLTDQRGNVTASYGVCSDGQEQVDVTGRLLALLFGVAILGVALLVTWALTGPAKEPEAPEFKAE
jgi:hypothetical protein